MPVLSLQFEASKRCHLNASKDAAFAALALAETETPPISQLFAQFWSYLMTVLPSENMPAWGGILFVDYWFQRKFLKDLLVIYQIKLFLLIHQSLFSILIAVFCTYRDESDHRWGEEEAARVFSSRCNLLQTRVEFGIHFSGIKVEENILITSMKPISFQVAAAVCLIRHPVYDVFY